MTSKQKWLLIGIIALAIGFRFYQIMAMPGGLFPDEAANGLDINLMQQGHLQPFYERGNGREALFFYLLWGSVELFGKGPWQHHIVSAGIGVLSVIGCFLVTRKLFQIFTKAGSNSNTSNSEPNSFIHKNATNLSLLASFLMAVSSWHIVLSRTAFRAILIPLFTSFAIYFMLLAFSANTRAKRYFWSIVTGATFGLGFYTYIAYRIFIPIVAFAILWPILVDLWQTPRAQAIKKFFVPTLTAGLSFTVIMSPIVYYFYTHPGTFIGRSGQVSIFNPDLNGGDLIGSILEVTRLSIKAYFWDGDLNWRHNISGQPFLSILVSPFFALGLTLVTLIAVRYIFTPIKNKSDWKYFLLAGWFWGMLIPVITTAEGIPHGLRSIGTIPAVFIISAVGISKIMKWANQFTAKFWDKLSPLQQSVLNWAFNIKTVAFILALILQSYFLYFIYAYNSPSNFYAFRSDLTPVSKYLNTDGNKANTYLILDKFSVQTVDYFTSIDGAHPENPKNQPYQQVDPEDSWKLQGLQNGDKIIFTQSSIFDIKKFKEYHPEAELTMEERNKFQQTVMAIYTIKK